MVHTTSVVHIMNLQTAANYESDWRGCTDARKYIKGYLILLNGGPIMLKSEIQALIYLSSAKDEYNALCNCAKKINCYRSFLISVENSEITELQ